MSRRDDNCPEETEGFALPVSRAAAPNEGLIKLSSSRLIRIRSQHGSYRSVRNAPKTWQKWQISWQKRNY
jgi:hypothetical protein